MGPKGDNDLGLDEFYLLNQVGDAVGNLVWLGISIAGGAALQNIGKEHLISSQAAGLDDLVEQFPGPAHKGSALCVFISAWRLTHKQDICPGMAFTRHSMGSSTGQFTQCTPAD
jgi:hypothetical protein